MQSDSKHPKFRLGEISPGTVGVFTDTLQGTTPSCWAVIPKGETGSAGPHLALLLAAPDLLEAAEAMLEYIDPYRHGDIAYNAAVMALKRATLRAAKDLDLESMLFREHFFQETHEKLSLEKGQPVQPQNNAEDVGRRVGKFLKKFW